MCGLAGIVYKERDRMANLSVLKAMADSIVHRGPDDEGFYCKNNVGLAFRRLSIIDISAGHQPLSNADESIFIVFNGEIYNFPELRESLKQKGYPFKTTTDTEVILHLYEEYGKDCVQHLRGMFAFAIWDNNKQQLFCARDRFGIKPFYYYNDNNQFAFGSEIKAILQAENIENNLCYDALDSYFAFGYITSDLSIYQKIKKLPPAHYLVLSFKEKVNIEIKRYWEINFQADCSKSEKQWCEEIENALSESVKIHMISDVPLGAFLSGGLDSSSVVALMAKNSNKPIQTFSIGFKEEKYNELQYAREIAQKYGCEHHEQIIEPESISLLPKLVRAYDEPFADSSAIPTYYVSKFAREFVTVALSGDGGDELFAGYDIYRYFKNIRKWSSSNPKFNTLFWGSIHKMISEKIPGKGTSHFLSQNKDYVGAHLSIWRADERNKLILNRGSKINAAIAPEFYKEQILQKGKQNDFITNLQNLDLQTYMVDDILTKVDRASMINSLEVRVPILDHKFAELTFNIPSELKLKGNNGKYIFRKSMSPLLTENVLNHPKQGFAVPLSVWFNKDWKEYINDTLLSANPLLANYLDKKYVKKVIENDRTGLRTGSTKIWTLLWFEEWLKQNQTL